MKEKEPRKSTVGGIPEPFTEGKMVFQQKTESDQYEDRKYRGNDQ